MVGVGDKVVVGDEVGVMDGDDVVVRYEDGGVRQFHGA